MSDTPSVPADGGQGANASPPSPPVSPPAAPPADQSPPPPPPPASPPEPPKPFYHDWDPELRGYTETKGFKDAKSAVEGYRNLEKLLGVPKDQILKLPADLRDAEAMKPVLERLGLAAPAEPKGYEFSAIEGIDETRAPFLEGIIHKHGVPAAMAKAVMADIVAQEAEWIKQQYQKEDEEAAVDRGKFNAKYGVKAEEKIEHARRFARNLGFTDEEMQAIELNMGPSAFWERFAKAGEMLGEANFTEGSRKQTFDMSPDAARAERDRLLTDPEFLKKYTTQGNLAEKQRIERLNQIIAQGRPA